MPLITIPEGRGNATLPFYVCTVGMHHNQAPCVRPYGAPMHHIFYIEQGSCTFEWGNKSVTLEAGTAVFMHRDLPITYYPASPDLITAWVTFNGNACGELLRHLHAASFSFCSSSCIYPKIQTIFHMSRSFASFAPLSAAAYELTVSYFSELNEACRPHALHKALRFLEEHYAEDIAVSEIAAASGISPSLLYRLFREWENTTPTARLRTIRIQNACILLLNGESFSLREIAYRCGFSDTAYFCRVFREELGVTPRNYRLRQLR